MGLLTRDPVVRRGKCPGGDDTGLNLKECLVIGLRGVFAGWGEVRVAACRRYSRQSWLEKKPGVVVGSGEV